MNHKIQSTQLRAYIANKPIEEIQKENVLKTIEKYGALCDTEIAGLTGYQLSAVNGRRNSLYNEKRVVESHRGKSPTSGREVIFWRATSTKELDRLIELDEFDRLKEMRRNKAKALWEARKIRRDYFLSQGNPNPSKIQKDAFMGGFLLSKGVFHA